MKTIISPLNNQQGSVMAIALMIMVTLTIVGLMSINDTIMESTVARNQNLYQQSLYLAEGAVRQATQILDDYAHDTEHRDELNENPHALPWIRHMAELPKFGKDVNWSQVDFRGDKGAVKYTPFFPSLMANGNNNASGFLVRYDGTTKGDSLKLGEATIKSSYTIWGRGVSAMRGDATEVIVEVAYTMRY